MAWIITKDFINGEYESNEVGTRSRGRKIREGEDVTLFRLYDGDDKLYFEGKQTKCENLDGFEPLDDFGMGGYGCTYIKYRAKDGTWKVL